MEFRDGLVLVFVCLNWVIVVDLGGLWLFFVKSVF